jgi:hypothetical protein
MDWMLATMKLGEPVSVPVGEEGVVQVRETIFADDASLYSASVGGIQKMVNACMLFCGFTGMRANLSKCRWLKTGEGVEENNTLDGVQWLPVKGWKARESKR